MLSRAKSLLLNTALAVALLAGAVAVAAETGMITLERPDGSSAVERSAQKIQVRGKVKDLYPGVTKTMKVRVYNGFPRKVTLVSVRAKVGDASPGCTRQNVRVKRFRGRNPIRAYGQTRVKVKVTLQSTSPDACQGARFPIKFKAKATG